MKPELKIVYVIVNGSSNTNIIEEGRLSDAVEEQELITFTQEEYNQHIKEVIEDALDTAAENAEWDVNDDADMYNVNVYINKESITNSLEEIVNKWKL